jgi:hypothetical protein
VGADHYEGISETQLHPAVPDDVRSCFEMAKSLVLYAWLYYPFFTTAHIHVALTVEMALRMKLPKAGKDCCVGEPHVLGGVHIVTHPSWSKPRSYCVEHLLERSASDYDLLQAWQQFQIRRSFRSEWKPEIGDFVLPPGHHGFLAGHQNRWKRCGHQITSERHERAS